MPQDHRHPLHQNWAFATMSIGWLLEDGLPIDAELARKLNVPPQHLLEALAGLTPAEREALKLGIQSAAASGPLKVPSRPMELRAFLDQFDARNPKIACLDGWGSVGPQSEDAHR